MTVDILLACYQGARYIEEQIASILAQKDVPFKLWIRDDGSTDATPKIITDWQKRYPHVINVIPGQNNLGIKANFAQLMAHSQAPYIMLADQDDYWLPGKVTESICRLQLLEKKWGVATPLLVHSDLCVVDANLKLLASSFWQYCRLDPRQTALNRLLMQNVVTGCTVACNRALLQLALPIPTDALMHDWWLALIASAFGAIDFLHIPTILYRQHGCNDTGAKRYGWSAAAKEIYPFKQNKCKKFPSQQASGFIESFWPLLAKQHHQYLLLQAVSDLEQYSWVKHIQTIWQHRLFKHGFLRNVKLFCQL